MVEGLQINQKQINRRKHKDNLHMQVEVVMRNSLKSQGLLGSCGKFNTGLMVVVVVVVVRKALWGFLMLREWVVCLHGN